MSRVLNVTLGEAHWIRLAIGDALQLIREPENRYDRQAVRIDWRGHKLGYIPRVQNHAITQLLDRGEKLGARIVALKTAFPLGSASTSRSSCRSVSKERKYANDAESNS